MTERKSQNDAGSSWSGARKDKSDSGVNERGTLLSMPVDLMFEVAGYVTLRDLVTLSYTSKALRGTLHSHSFSIVWRAARRAAGVPDCSPGFLEPQWAVFLYGPPVCERCGATNTHRVDIRIRRRICARCKKKYLINTIKFSDLFPHCDAAVLDMVPCTLSGGWPPSTKHWGEYRGMFFWTSDIKRVGAEWALLQDDVQAHVEGAGERAAAYRVQRVLEVKRVMEYVDEFSDAVRDIGMESRKKAIEKNMSRFDAIRTRLLALGYDARDINYTAFYPPEFQRGAELTEESWEYMQPRAVALVESRRDARLEGKHVVTQLQRINMLQKLYLEYAESVAPQEWCYLPSIYELTEFPGFKSILEADSSAALFAQTLSAVELPTMISEWVSAKKARIMAMLGSRSRTVGDPLNLATSVFECTSSACFRVSRGYDEEQKQYPLISWEVIAAHSCQPIGHYKPRYYTPTSIGVSHRGGMTAATLVRRAGLDPTSATITQMDALDLRFACLECPPPTAGSRLRIGYPWKLAVKHGMETEHAIWHKMSSGEAECVRTKEGKWGSIWDWQGSWSCNHCAHYFNRRHLKYKVVQHLRDVHQIRSPTEPADLFCYPVDYPSSHALGSAEVAEPPPSDVAI